VKDYWRLNPSSDERLRQLEMQAATGDKEAWEELNNLRRQMGLDYAITEGALEGSLRLGRDTSEWHLAWDALFECWTLKADRCDDCGEGWQYLGSYHVEGTYEYQHEFRHRHHPQEQRRIVHNIPASPGWVDSLLSP